MRGNTQRCPYSDCKQCTIPRTARSGSSVLRNGLDVLRDGLPAASCSSRDVVQSELAGSGRDDPSLVRVERAVGDVIGGVRSGSSRYDSVWIGPSARRLERSWEEVEGK